MANNGKVSFGEAIKLFFKNYTNFAGKESRSEFWWAFLFTFIVSTVLGAISATIAGICGLALLIPELAISVRRLHDVGKSGWFLLIGLIPLVGGIILLVQMLKDSK